MTDTRTKNTDKSLYADVNKDRESEIQYDFSMVKPVFTIGPSPQARAIREEVFVREQGFEEEFDEADASSISLVLYFDGNPIATGRLVKVDPATYSIGRVAVRKPFRGKNVGTYLMEFLFEKARELGALTVLVHAQLDKQHFYRRLGFIDDQDGLVDYEQDVAHIHLRKALYDRAHFRKRKGSL